MILVLVCLPSDAVLQHLLSYVGFPYLGRGVSLHCCSSKAQPLLLTLNEVYFLTASTPDLDRGVAALVPLVLLQPPLHGHVVSMLSSLERLMLKLQLQFFAHLMKRTVSLEKILMLGRNEGQGEGDERG